MFIDYFRETPVNINPMWKRILILTLFSLNACQESPSHLYTANAAVAKALPPDDQRDLEEATRGLIATPENLRINSDSDELI